jgi:hypothetical protein
MRRHLLCSAAIVLALGTALATRATAEEGLVSKFMNLFSDPAVAACRKRMADRMGDWILKECIAACDTGCWYGYAQNRRSKKFEWFWIGYYDYPQCVGCVYRKLKPGRSGDGVRLGWGTI